MKINRIYADAKKHRDAWDKATDEQRYLFRRIHDCDDDIEHTTNLHDLNIHRREKAQFFDALISTGWIKRVPKEVSV